MSMNNTKFKKGIHGSQKALNGFQKQLKAVGGMVAGAFAVTSVIRFGKASFQALDTQRKAEAALSTAIGGRVDVQERLFQQAKELQKVTLFGDEETIRAQSLLAAFTNEEETIKRLIPLIQDFATAKQMDLAGAADLVSKTIGSSTNALSRYGIQVTGAVGSSERLESLVRGLSNAFAGQAKAAADADTALTQLKNTIGDVKEDFAAMLLDAGPAVRDFGNAIGEENIRVWDKFLSLFSVQKAIEISAVASAFDAKQVSGADQIVGRMSGIRGVKGKLNASRQEVAAAYAKVKTPNAMDPMTAQDDKWVGQRLDWSRDPAGYTSLEGLQAYGDMLSHITDQMDEWEMEWEEAFGGESFSKVEKMTLQTEKLGKSVGIMLVNSFDQLGVAIGGALNGADDALKQLGETILQNMGNILMMAGFSMGPAGIPLLIAGAVMQLGSGIIKGLGQSTPDVVNPGGGSAGVDFRIKGGDLVGVMNRQSYSQNLNT
jgi:hypothetical protein